MSINPCLSRGAFTIKKETFYLVGANAVTFKGTTAQPGDKVRLYLGADWDPEVTSRPNDWQLAAPEDNFYADDRFYSNAAIAPFVLDIAILGRASRVVKKQQTGAEDPVL